MGTWHIHFALTIQLLLLDTLRAENIPHDVLLDFYLEKNPVRFNWKDEREASLLTDGV